MNIIQLRSIHTHIIEAAVSAVEDTGCETPTIHNLLSEPILRSMIKCLAYEAGYRPEAAETLAQTVPGFTCRPCVQKSTESYWTELTGSVSAIGHTFSKYLLKKMDHKTKMSK